MLRLGLGPDAGLKTLGGMSSRGAETEASMECARNVGKLTYMLAWLLNRQKECCNEMARLRIRCDILVSLRLSSSASLKQTRAGEKGHAAPSNSDRGLPCRYP